MLFLSMANFKIYPEIRQLFYFAVVAKELNIRRSAMRLNIAQPPLSRHMKRLEKDLGLKLFIRNNRGLTLTEHGEKLLDIAQPLLAQYARCRAELDELRTKTDS